MKCSICDGEGFVLAEEADEICPLCEGAGQARGHLVVLASMYLVVTRATGRILRWIRTGGR